MSKLNVAIDQLQQPAQLQHARADAGQAEDAAHIDADAARHLTAIRIRGQLAEVDGDGSQS